MNWKDIPLNRLLPLSLQHVFAMFGATVLVPILTGLNPLTALFTSATGTLLFHLVTGGKVPAYLGSSFAFIAPIIAVKSSMGVAAATGACLVAGLMYLVVALLVKLVGLQAIQRFIPPVVVGPVIMTIGLALAPEAKNMVTAYETSNIFIAMVTLAAAIAISIFAKGIFKILPILGGVVIGYVFTLILQIESVFNLPFVQAVLPEKIIDLSAVGDAAWFALPKFVNEAAYSATGGAEFLLPRFALPALLIIAPIAIVTMVEHLGDMLAISKTAETDYLDKPGLHRTLTGDGLATAWAGLFGGPPNTTYGENIAVLAITKVFNPIVVQLAAVFIFIFSLSPKLGALLNTIPDAVKGGIAILLFGMITAVGIRTLVEKQVDLSKVRNLIIVSTILILGISGIGLFQYQLETSQVFLLEGMGLGAVVGLLLNILLPDKD